jgi:hypothetical protein
MKHHEIKLEDLQKWIETEDVTFASSTRERKRLTCCLDGYLQVIVGNAIVWRGKQLDLAIERYNSVTEKYIDTSKDFRI